MINKCPNCGKTLNEDEKVLYKCTSCGKKIQNDVSFNFEKNTISNIIKFCGFAVIILGTIYSFMSASDRDYEYHFNLLLFIASEIISIVSGILLLGLSEIVQVLDDIKHRLQ